MSRITTVFCAALLATFVGGPAAAAPWPTDTVTIVVPYTPGNITDIAARVVAQKLSERTGKAFIVENKAGASTQIGTNMVARSRPDGRTLLITGAAVVTNPFLFSSMPYDTEKDLAPVGLVVSNPLVLVTAKAKPFSDFKSFVAYAKGNPGKATISSGGNGTLSHMSMELMTVSTNTNIVHVPYKGGSAAVTDTLAGQVDGLWDNPSSAIPHINAGRTRALAVTGRQRNPALPNVPTVEELGYEGFEVINWFAMFAPGKSDPALLDTIHKEVQAVLELPDVQERFAKDGVKAGGPSRSEFAAFVAAEAKKWGAIIKDKNIRAD